MAHQRTNSAATRSRPRPIERPALQLIRGGRQVDVRQDPGEEFDRAGVREHLLEGACKVKDGHTSAASGLMHASLTSLR